MKKPGMTAIRLAASHPWLAFDEEAPEEDCGATALEQLEAVQTMLAALPGFESIDDSRYGC
jgi:hypothetical protein